MLSMFTKFSQTINNRLKNIIKRSIVNLITVNGDHQIAQVSYLDKVKNIEVIYPYGLNATPPAKSTVLQFNVLANEENGAGIIYNTSLKFGSLGDGEVVVGNPSTQSKVYFKANGDIEVVGSGDVKITSSNNVEILSANEINLNGGTEALVKGNTFQTIYNAHIHTSAAPGSPTTPPTVQLTGTELSTKNKMD